jgi:phage terminase large subunit-like protein
VLLGLNIGHLLRSFRYFFVKAGPKAAPSDRALVATGLPPSGPERVIAWIEKFIRTPKGTGARKPMVLREWQRELIRDAFAEPRPRLALWSLPRGQGKTTLAAALGLWALFSGEEGARVYVVAVDERQARLTFDAAVRMVELSEPLAKRVQMFQSRIVVPRTGSQFVVLSATPANLEGLDPSLMIIDEIGVVDRRTYEVAALASGKRDSSLTLCIGTPSPDAADSVMFDLRSYAIANPEDNSIAFREFAAPDGCDLDDEEAWSAANPALHDFLHADAMRALLPPKTREATFRRARLGQWVVSADDVWVTPQEWAGLCTGEVIEDGSDVVLALDGSFSQDSTGLVVCRIGSIPHLDVAGHWANPGDPEWRVDVLAVEEAIRAACLRWRVAEVTADPYRWQRSLQVLAADGIRVSEYPQSAQRMTPATTGLREAVTNKTVTHSGSPALAEHVANARVSEDHRGTRLHKASKKSDKRIDLAVCALMAHSRAVHYATHLQRSRRIVRTRR